MDHKKRLNTNERLVFHRLIRYPNMNDREISENTEIKLSTVTAIRRRLQSSDYFSTYRMPNFQAMGLEMLVIGYGPISSGDGSTNTLRMFEKTIEASDSFFFAAHSQESAFFVGAARNYTEAKKSIENIQSVLASQTMSDGWHFVFFPFEISSILNMFNCANVVERALDFEPTHKSTEINQIHTSSINLTAKEKKVLKKLVEMSTASDNAVAAKVGASRQGVSAMRKRFCDSGLIRTIRIPNFQKLGYGIFVVAHTVFNPQITIQERGIGINFMVDKVPQIMLVSGNFENVLMAVARDYEEFSFFKKSIIQMYRQHEFIRNEPSIVLMPFKEMTIIKNHEYSPILEKLWRQ